MQTPTTAQLGKDAIVAVALAITLAGVYVIDFTISSGRPGASGGGGEAGGEHQSQGVTLGETQETETVVASETTTQPKPLRLAVTPAQYDDMGNLLRQLGEGYRYDQISMDDLMNLDKLRNYDVVFVTCGSYPESWVGALVGQGQRDATVYGWNEEIARRVKEGLRAYVLQGGTLYASDWRFSMLQMAFEEFFQPPHAEGDKQGLEAEVVDGGLREQLGPSIRLNFDLPGWHPASFGGNDVTTYLSGEFNTLEGQRMTKPLLVKIRHGEGQIFYTAFHNEKQHSEEELQLLRYLVFTMVTSRVESKVRATMVQGGFSPQKQSLLSTSAGEPSVTKTYRCDKAGPLLFVLAFEDRGALLHLKVEGPDGRKFEKEGTSTVQIDVPDAQLGDWKYTITAKKVPFENFPFTFTVGQK